MDFSKWCAEQGFDPAALDDKQKLSMQAAWRRDCATKLQELQDSRTPGPLGYMATTPSEPHRRALIEAGLLSHLGVRSQHIAAAYGERVTDAVSRREYRVNGIQQVLREFMQAAGKHAPTGKFSDSDIANAFRLDRSLPMGGSARDAYGGPLSVGPSTLSLSGILSNVANKLLYAAFMDTPTTWGTWAKTGSVNDFKDAKRYRMVGDGEFVQVAPGGQIQHVSLGESSATAKANTYGALLGIDRRDLINDDLGAFANVPKVLSRMAAMKIEKTAVAKLLENAGGTVSGFFSTANGNYDDGSSDSVLSLAGLDNALAMFGAQTDGNGDPIMMGPKLLVVPPALEATARTLMASMELTGSTTADALKPSGNPWAGRFTVVVVPHLSTAFGLTNASNTAWYLLVEPSDFSPVEVVFLDGKIAPTVETAEMDFDRLGISMRAFSDFGVNTLEHRGGLLMKGAA